MGTLIADRDNSFTTKAVFIVHISGHISAFPQSLAVTVQNLEPTVAHGFRIDLDQEEEAALAVKAARMVEKRKIEDDEDNDDDEHNDDDNDDNEDNDDEHDGDDEEEGMLPILMFFTASI